MVALFIIVCLKNSKHLIGFPIYPHCPHLPEGKESMSQWLSVEGSALEPLWSEQQTAVQGWLSSKKGFIREVE